MYIEMYCNNKLLVKQMMLYTTDQTDDICTGLKNNCFVHV